MAGHKPLSESQQLIARRRVARRLAMQGAYQWLITGNGFQETYLYFQEDIDLAADFRKSDAAFFHKLLRCAMEGGKNWKAVFPRTLTASCHKLTRLNTRCCG